MYQRKDGTWCDTRPRKGQSPKFFYGKTKAIVKEKMAKWQEEQDQGVLFKEALELWWDSKDSLKEPTRKLYKIQYDYCLEKYGNLRMSEITPNMLQTRINSFASKDYSRTYPIAFKTVVSGAFQQAMMMQDSKITFNPADALKIPASMKTVRRDLPSREAIKIIKENVDKDFGLFPYLIIYTGLRKGEALALTDKDFTEDSIIINKAVKHYSSGAILDTPKTESGIRTVPLLKPLKDKLPKWQGYLFSDDGGEHFLTFSHYLKLWRTYGLEVGLAHDQGKKLPPKFDICIHQLRHEFATICFDAGLDPMDAADIMGHSSAQTTREIYTHIQESRRKKSVDKLSDYVENVY